MLCIFYHNKKRKNMKLYVFVYENIKPHVGNFLNQNTRGRKAEYEKFLMEKGYTSSTYTLSEQERIYLASLALNGLLQFFFYNLVCENNWYNAICIRIALSLKQLAAYIFFHVLQIFYIKFYWKRGLHFLHFLTGYCQHKGKLLIHMYLYFIWLLY